MFTHLLLRIRSPLSLSLRGKRNKFKPKIAKVAPTKTPSNFALDHFDFYYKPFFGKRWPSIRLGLLSPNQYVAVINTLSSSWRINKTFLEEEGTIDLIEKINGGSTERRSEKKMRKMNGLANDETKKIVDELNEGASTSQETSTEIEDGEIMRSELGIGQFNPARGELSQGEKQFGSSTLVKDIQITGYEGEGVQIPVRTHFISYPKELRIQTMQRSDISRYPPPIRDGQQVPGWWLLDGGSVVPILALNFQKDETFLDLCAAPGGKSLLALLTRLPKKIVCNDYKLARLGDLKRSLSVYVPAESPEAEKVIIKRKDASNLEDWDEINVYDKVLADVPCLSDRLSVSQDEGNFFEAQHTQKRLNLPQLQTKMLINALRAARLGGSVVYSTCTLSPSQNEAVIENAVAIAEQKFGIKVIEESLALLKNHLASTGLYRFSDETQRGLLVLPFLLSNFGPMYVCKLNRLR